MISGLDIPAGRCIAVNDAIHYVLCRDGVYEYSGGKNFVKISEPIDDIFRNQINIDSLEYAHLQFVREEGELRCYLPELGNTQPNVCWICKVNDNFTWFKDTRACTATGKSTTIAGITIGDLVGNISAQTWKFGDYMVGANAPVQLVTDLAGFASKMDKTVYSIVQSGTTVSQVFTVDTKDLSSIKDIDPLVKDYYKTSLYMENETRWLGATYELKGTGVATLQYSVDAGSSWASFPEGNKTLTENWKLHHWDLDYAAPQIRLRLVNTGKDESIHLRYTRVDFVPGSRDDHGA
jgi:hypothetical protein